MHLEDSLDSMVADLRSLIRRERRTADQRVDETRERWAAQFDDLQRQLAAAEKKNAELGLELRDRTNWLATALIELDGAMCPTCEGAGTVTVYAQETGPQAEGGNEVYAGQEPCEDCLGIGKEIL